MGEQEYLDGFVTKDPYQNKVEGNDATQDTRSPKQNVHPFFHIKQNRKKYGLMKVGMFFTGWPVTYDGTSFPFFQKSLSFAPTKFVVSVPSKSKRLAVEDEEEE